VPKNEADYHWLMSIAGNSLYWSNKRREQNEESRRGAGIQASLVIAGDDYGFVEIEFHIAFLFH